MFEGFNVSTTKYYDMIKKNNSKENFHQIESLYKEGVKEPLEELYYELSRYLSKIDMDLICDKRRCISSAYNDARFCKENPIKEYFYIRFKLGSIDKKNALGFFIDADRDDFRYGLNIYKPDARGTERIRYGLLEDTEYSEELINKFIEDGIFTLDGQKYKKSYYPEESEALQDWLNRKSLFIYHMEPVNQTFYSRELFNQMTGSFEQIKDIYYLFKQALVSRIY